MELAATNQTVAELYYHFVVMRTGCQPLSQRPDDIKPLFRHYLHKACLRLNHPVSEVEVDLLRGMRCRIRLSNTRELANTAELFAAGLLPPVGTVSPQLHLPELIPLGHWIDECERQITTEALNIHQGRTNEVAECLQVPCRRPYLRMRKYGLNKEHYEFQQVACGEEERVTVFRR